MIVIKVELWPYGYEERKEDLGVCAIWNTGEGTPTRGSYRYRLWFERKMISGDIDNFPRKRLTAWDLLCRILVKALGDRNKSHG